MRLDQLVSASEAARMAGIELDTFTSYVNRGQNGVPAPVGRVAGRRVWDRGEVKAWVAARRKRDRKRARVAARKS